MEHWIKTDYNENQEPYGTLNESRTIWNTESKQTNENQEPYGTLNQNRL